MFRDSLLRAGAPRAGPRVPSEAEAGLGALAGGGRPPGTRGWAGQSAGGAGVVGLGAGGGRVTLRVLGALLSGRLGRRRSE